MTNINVIKLVIVKHLIMLFEMYSYFEYLICLYVLTLIVSKRNSHQIDPLTFIFEWNY